MMPIAIIYIDEEQKVENGEKEVHRDSILDYSIIL